MHADISQYVDINILKFTILNRLELAKQLFWFSESSGSLTGIQKNNIFSAGLDMHVDISQYVDIIILKSEVTLIDWNLLSNFSDFPRAVVR